MIQDTLAQIKETGDNVARFCIMLFFYSAINSSSMLIADFETGVPGP